MDNYSCLNIAKPLQIQCLMVYTQNIWQQLWYIQIKLVALTAEAKNYYFIVVLVPWLIGLNS